MKVFFENLILRLFGVCPLIFINEPASFDRWLWLRRVIKKGSEIKSLDAGSGSGVFTIFAAKIGGSAVGISFDEVKNANAKRRARVLNVNASFATADLRKLDETKEKFGLFDQIICFETIEHIMDDKKLVKNLSDFLYPGGILLITTPYKNYIPNSYDSVSEIEDGGHVRWGYTFEEMRSLLQGVGLWVFEEKYASGFITQMLGRMTRFFDMLYPKLGWAVVLPLRIFQVFDKPLTALLGYPYSTICVAAEKPVSKK